MSAEQPPQRAQQQQQQQRPPEATAQPRPPAPGVISLAPSGGWDIRNAGQLWELAGHLAKSDLKPKGMRSQADVFLVMAYGQMYGFSEMEALQKLQVIKGKVGLPAQEMVAKIRAHPLCRSYRLWVEGEGEARVGCCQSWRLGQEQPNDVVRFSIGEARRAGLYDEDWRDSNQEPSNWVKYPDDQLIWKAAARDYRRNWPDAYGYRLTPVEELREIARSERDDETPALEMAPAPRWAAPPAASLVLQALAAGEQPIAFELPRARERELVERSPAHASAAPQQLTLEVEPTPVAEKVAVLEQAEPAPPFTGELLPELRQAIHRRVASANLIDEHAARAADELEELVRVMVGAGRVPAAVKIAVRDWRPKWG
jgi:hypothetical protein